MRVRIEAGMSVLLDIDDEGENVLLPLDEDERAKAFKALTGALALLGGIRPLASSAAKASATGERSTGSEQCPSGRRGGDLVHLSERRASRFLRSTHALSGHDPTNC